MASINADSELVNKPSWWKRLWAGVIDVVSTWLNAQANQSYLRTAKTRRAAQDILEPLGYNLTPQVSSTGTVLFDIDPSASLPFTLLSTDQVAIYPGSTSLTSRRFEGRSDVVIDSLTESTLSSAWAYSTGIVTVAGSNYITGEKVRLSTSGGLPSGLATATDYYVILVSSTQIKLATTRANAYAGTALSFASAGTGNHTIIRLSRQITCWQQTTMARQIIGTSDGVTAWQEFNVAQVGIQSATVSVLINGEAWPVVSWLGDYRPNDKVCALWFETDGTMTVQFGDGVNYGAIPGTYDIYLDGAWGGGATSNVSGIGSVSSYGGTNSNIKGVSNPQGMTGGADPESIAVAAKIAPYQIAAGRRFVTTQDGEALALAYGGLSLVKINKNAYGTLSVQVVGIASGGGNPSSTLRSAIAADLIAKSCLEEVYVQFDAATITAKNVTYAMKMSTGYLYANVTPYANLAWKLFFSEKGAQVLTEYQANGASGATTLINTLFSTTFGTSDYAAIARILDLWNNGQYSPRDFGDIIQESQAFGFIQSGVLGINYMTIAAPSFPITLAADEITTEGTVTPSEIT